jgi:hypothetical protein
MAVVEVVVSLPSLLLLPCWSGVVVAVLVVSGVVSKTEDDDNDAVTAAVVVVAGDIFSIRLLYEEKI